MIFGLPATLSDKIVAVSNQQNISSLRDYSGILDVEEILAIRKVFENLTQEQLDRFQQGPSFAAAQPIV
jgi:hypothetical protein